MILFLDEIIETPEKKELEFFGYDAFQNNPEIFQDESFAADPSYQIGPGDDIVIMLWGDTELQSVLHCIP